MPGFIDEAQIHVKAGNGGAGAVSFRREAHVSRGGPDGGDGGRGGDIWLVASTGVSSLLAFKDHPHRRAADGAHGRGKGSRGGDGADLEVRVPVGTTVRALDGASVADLSAPGDRALVARGGRGGRGNAKFLSNRRRAPAFAEQAELGEERWLDLELKLLADVALVGFPNSGKSTFVSAVSAARPKIADYPFTTLVPHLGVVRVPGGGEDGEDSEFVVADVPGLIEGAAVGKGLGHQFLRHVERARVLLLLLDLGPASRDPAVQQEILLGELLDRPRVVVGSKGDVAEAAWRTELGDLPVISAVTGLGMPALMSRLAALVADARRSDVTFGVAGSGEEGDQGPHDADPAHSGGRPPTPFVHRPLGEAPVEVTRGPDGTFIVGGRSALRAVALSDLTDDDAMDLVQVRLRKLGVERALVRAGVRDGDQVQVGDLAFTYHPDSELSAGSSGPVKRGSRGRKPAQGARNTRRRDDPGS